LSTLGVALKNPLNKEKDFSQELQSTMQAWIEFTTRYMTNPPPEARNDRNWVKKMQQTSKRIGKLRKLIGNKELMPAHNLVLDISSKIGKFFEAVGISDEKKLFIETSTNATILENMVLQSKNQKAVNAIASLSANLKDFASLIPRTASSTIDQLGKNLENLEQKIKQNNNIKHLDPEVVQITATFEQLRSLILMQEWFPETTDQD
jgi:vacuolar-type H+-ATPase catalytic subunit A/Vma1